MKCSPFHSRKTVALCSAFSIVFSSAQPIHAVPPVPPPPTVTTANRELDFDANLDTDENSTWESTLSEQGMNFSLGTAVTRIASNPGTSLDPGGTPGITAAYQFPGLSSTNAASERAASEDYDGPPFSSTQQNATFEFWVKIDDKSTNQVIWETGGSGDGVSLVIRNDGNLQWSVKDSGQSVSTTTAFPNDSNYHQVVGVVDFSEGGNPTVRLYVDGATPPSFNTNNGVNDFAGSNKTGLGGYEDNSLGATGSQGLNQNNYQNTLDGDIAIHRYYRAALDDAAVLANFNAVKAATVTFDNDSADGTWGNPLNWDTNLEPTTAQDVVIGAGSAVTVEHGNARGKALSLDNNLTIGDGTADSGQLSLAGNVSTTAAPTISLDGGGLDMNGNEIGTDTNKVGLTFTANGSSLSNVAEINGINGNAFADELLITAGTHVLTNNDFDNRVKIGPTGGTTEQVPDSNNRATVQVGDDGALGSGKVSVWAGRIMSDSTEARTIGNEILVKNGDGSGIYLGDNVNTGKLTLFGPVRNINPDEVRPTDRGWSVESAVEVTGVLSGGSMTKYLGGTLTLGGTAANTFSGLTLSQGTVVFAKSDGVNAINGNTDIRSSGTLRLGGNEQIGNNREVKVRGGGLFDLNGNSETINILRDQSSTDRGVVDNTSGTASNLTIGASGGSGTFRGVIKNSGGGALSLEKTGAGTLTLGGSNTYSGSTKISNGTLTVGTGGAIPDGSDVTIDAGASMNLNGQTEAINGLGGNGSVTGGGTLTVNKSGGSLAPGASVGKLTVDGNLNLDPSGSFDVEIEGSAGAGVAGGHDVIDVSGTGRAVNLAGALNIANTAPGHVSGPLTIMNLVDGTSSLNGTFAGLGQGSGILSGGQVFSINYQGDSGNPVGVGNDLVLETGNVKYWRGGVDGGTLGWNRDENWYEDAAGSLAGAPQAVANDIVVLSTANVRRDIININGADRTVGSFVVLPSAGFTGTDQGSASGKFEVREGFGTPGSNLILTHQKAIQMLSDESKKNRLLDFRADGEGGERGDFNLLFQNGAEGSIIDVQGATDEVRISFDINNAGANNSTSITKTGAGLLTLLGDNLYSGDIVVAEGTLVVDGDLGSAGVSVADGATLSGSGDLGGVVTITGTHSPGNSPGVQNFADLNYATNASFLWELTDNTALGTIQAGPTFDFDQVVVSGDLDFAGSNTFDLDFRLEDMGGNGTTNVDWMNSFWETNQEWLVWDVAGTTTGFSNLQVNVLNWEDGTNPAGNLFDDVFPLGQFYLNQRGSDIYLNFTPVPEPSTVLVLLGGFLSMMLGRRRRKLVVS